MKTIFLLLILTLLCGCAPKQKPKQIDQRMIEFYGKSQWYLLTDAIGRANNKEEVLPILSALIQTNLIDGLAHQSAKTLTGYLEDSQSGLCPYTRQELIQAIKLRNARPTVHQKMEVPPE